MPGAMPSPLRSGFRSTVLASWIALGALALGCSSPSPTDDVPNTDGGARDGGDVVDVPPGVFNDHTVRRVEGAADFATLSSPAHGVASTKLVITSFLDPARRDLVFYDANFYTLHDEWYWFRLLNGQAIPGDPGVAPVRGLSFPTIRSIYDWARGRTSLPLDLQIADGRLYSWRFYDMAFGRERSRGLATMMHLDARAGTAPTPERWGFELEYGDAVTHPELVIFFETIAAHVGPDIARDLRFVVRSAEHEALAQQMERERLPYWDRILRYRDIINPGAREVYSDGVAAGSLRFIRAGQRFDDTTPEDILVFEQLPDLLPPAAGVITAVPQTPLAHINLLARNRGIPNAHIAGVLENAEISQLERGWARVVMYAEAPSRVVVAAITAEQYDRYHALLQRPVRAVVTPPVASMPYLIDLSSRPLSDRASLIPTIGGKSAGFLGLLHDDALERPDRPHGITVRAYVEHIAPLRARIEAALRAPQFDVDSRVRLITLEGVDAFRARNQDAASTAFANAYLSANAMTTDYGALIRNGGVRGLVERTPVAPATLATILTTLRAAFSDLAVTQGIRFRSSSNVEDVEGFNGAGLYESFTGFLYPEMQPRASDQAKTAEYAILRVWGSYWGFEAFEERRLERIDHLGAAMGVAVHPRFDDALERATGVCTFTLMPPNAPDDARLEVNIQAGDQSVANPDPAVLPEVLRISRARGTSTLRFERVRRSTLSPGADLLGEPALRRLFEDTSRVVTRWLDDENRTRPAAQRGRSLTLDFEFHDMMAGWPAMRDGAVRPARLVLKQARSLEPGPAANVPEAPSWPMPRDVYVRARRVSIDTCSADLATDARFRASILRVATDASRIPDVGYATSPLDASLTVTVEGGAIPELGWTAGATYTADHTQLTTTRETGLARFDVRADAPAAAGLTRFEIVSGGRATVTNGARRFEATLQCVTELRFASPRDYLLSLVPQP